MADWVIVVDDDTENLKLAGSILSKNGMRVTALKSGNTFLEYIKEHGEPDIVLLDIMMPDMDGFDTLIRLRNYEESSGSGSVPVVFLTADENRQHEMRGFQMGVSDFIHKPFDPDIFAQRVANIIASSKKMISIEEKATHDDLTGFLTKDPANEQISSMCLKEFGSLCMIDLDSFKLVNDMYGHEMGDRVLVKFADVLRANMTEGSICGRIGGDEFLLFALNMQRESDIASFTGRVNDGFTDAAKELLGEDHRIPLGVSIGAVSVPKQGTELDELFNMADKALYTVKDNGKHGYALYHDEHLNAMTDASGAYMDLKTLSKMLEERSIPQSVMWMGREAFGNVYRYMMRYLERYDISAYKVLFTLCHKDKDITDEQREEVADSFREVIQTTLRNSDIMVRIGIDQFFLLLPELNPEHIDRVINRMSGAWKKSNQGPATELELEYDRIASDSRHDIKSSGSDSDLVVVVDDDHSNLMMAERILKKEGMNVECIGSGTELLEYVQDHDPALILLDVNMPGIDGFETMQRLTSRGGRIARIPVIFLTANDDDETETQGFVMGAMDFIRKPFVPEILIMRVKHAISLIRLQNHLKSEVSEKTEENESLSLHIIQALASAVDAKDMYTSGHSGRVAEYARMISARYGYDEEAQDKIYMIGLLHDVGKIGISDAIINKVGALDDKEYEIIKTHPVQGAKILGKIKEMPELVIGAKWHHERYDGKGYPDGLTGEDIPEEARIIAVADSYDAMTSRRSYRDALPQEKVRSEIVNGKGTQFDPKFAEIMLELIDEDTQYSMREE
ncbi:MAG: response regulator [Lachnospiraceae bacterium]|nr:response regulator [Lachnospiraceae bacterium]